MEVNYVTGSYGDGQILTAGSFNLEHRNLERIALGGYFTHFVGSLLPVADFEGGGAAALEVKNSTIIAKGDQTLLKHEKFFCDRSDGTIVFEARAKWLPASNGKNTFSMGIASATDDAKGLMQFKRTNAPVGSWSYQVFDADGTGSTVVFDNASDPGSGVYATYRLETNAGSAVFYMNNVAKASITTNLPTSTIKLRPRFTGQDNGEAGSLVVDFFHVTREV